MPSVSITSATVSFIPSHYNNQFSISHRSTDNLFPIYHISLAFQIRFFERDRSVVKLSRLTFGRGSHHRFRFDRLVGPNASRSRPLGRTQRRRRQTTALRSRRRPDRRQRIHPASSGLVVLHWRKRMVFLLGTRADEICDCHIFNILVS